MDADRRRLYTALAARDRRFDGLFFVAVTSTRIYCRPICPVRTPKEANCRFFDTAQEAEQAGFRPCLRCRPELAPGSAPVDDAERVAQLIVQRLEEGTLDERAGLERIAEQFELSSRQIRRIVQRELGVPPIQLLLTRRLLLAKQLLTETLLPVTDVAFASGFSSLRRFNDAFSTRYRMPPTRLRRQVQQDGERRSRTAPRRFCSSPIVRRSTGLAFSRFSRRAPSLASNGSPPMHTRGPSPWEMRAAGSG
jgi:AraC family transcriptional regulator of adaptative response / DNA-3-methyladenine glycosylase II